MRKWLHLPVMAERISTGMRLVVLLLFTGFLGQAQDGDYTYEGETLDPVVAEARLKIMFKELTDIDRLIHSVSIGKIAKDTRLVEYAEGFMERNQIEVLTIGYIDSDAIWPRVFKNQRLKKIEKADTDNLLVGKIIFVPVEDGEDITGYTVELQLTGKAVSVYELLDVSKEQLDLIAEETTEEELGSTEYAKPKLAQDAVVNAMILALQRVDEQSNTEPGGNTTQHVAFAAASNQQFGFDGSFKTEFKTDYPSIRVGGKSYRSAWKSLKSNTPDQVIATDPANQDLTFEFNGTPVTATSGADDTYSLTLTGQSDEVEGELLVKVGDYLAGQLNTISYDNVEQVVKIVPINGAGGGITQGQLQTKLNEIYGVAIASWNVEVLANQNLGTAWDDEGNGLEVGDNSTLSNYTSEMNDLIRAFKQNNDRDKKAYYVFLVNKAESSTYLGYMPRKKQWGFVFTEGQSTDQLITTIAHELGHGVYRLEHTFSEKGIPKGQTQNLMDYAGGTDLYKYQWDYVHDPESVVTLFDDEEDAAYGNGQDETFEEYVTRQLDQLYGSTSETVLGLGYCQKCARDDGNTGYERKLNVDESALTVSSPDTKCTFYIYSKEYDDVFVGEGEEAAEEVAGLLEGSYSNGRALFAILNRTILTDLPTPIFPCSEFISDKLKEYDYCTSEEITKEVFDEFFASIDECIEGKFSIIATEDFNLLQDELNKPILSNEKIKIELKDGDLAQELLSSGMKSEEQEDMRLTFEKKDDVWTSSLTVNKDYLTSSGYSSSEADELIKLLADLYEKSKVEFCDNLLSPSCFRRVLKFWQVMRINIESIGESGTTHHAMWDDDPKAPYEDVRHLVPTDMQWSPLVGGSVDAIAETITSLPLLVITAGQIIIDEEQQQAFVQLFSKEGWDALTEQFASDILDVINDSDKREYAVSKASVELVMAYAVILGKAATSLEQAVKWLRDLATKVDQTPSLMAYLKKVVKDDPSTVKAKQLENLLENIGADDLEKLFKDLDVDQVDGFVTDFGDDLTTAKRFVDGDLSVNSWESISRAAKRANPDIADAGKILRKDIKSLEAFAKFDADLIGKIGQQRFDDFTTSLIKANPKCKTCGNAGDRLVGNLDEVMDDLHEVVTKRVDFSDADLAKGFDDFLKEAGEQASKAKGSALTLKKMARNWDELTEGGWSLKGFEGNIPDIETGHRLDLKLGRTVDGAPEIKSIEMKNWSSPRSISGSAYDQFKAYISSGNQFDYYFSDGLSNTMKGNFQNVFKDASKANELWDANPSFFQGLSNDITSVDDLIDLANDGDLVDLINWVN